MEEELKYFEEIESYHEGKMGSSERLLFEQQLASNKQLQDENELYIKLVNSLKNSENEIRKEFNRIDAALDKKLIPTKIIDIKKGNYKWIYLAASVILIAALAYMFNLKTNSLPSLAEQYAIEEPGLPVLMGNETNTIFNNAMSAYKMQQYDKAAALIEKLSANSSNDTLLYFAGVFHEMNNEYNVSEKYYSSVINISTSMFYYNSTMRLSLLYLKMNKKEDARILLRKIAGEFENPYKSLAVEIEKKIL